jgi:hypothetical protein
MYPKEHFIQYDGDRDHCNGVWLCKKDSKLNSKYKTVKLEFIAEEECGI